MKARVLCLALGPLVGLITLGAACTSNPQSDYPIKSVPLTSVQFKDGFWASRQATDIAVTIRHEMKESEETLRIKNFEIAAAALKGAKDGKFASHYAFDDSDVYKVIEAASYILMLKPDPELDKALDGWIAKIAAAQEPDGYLYTARTIDPKNAPRMSGPERWLNLRDSHELYNIGHMYEAAVAHNQATGKKNFLSVALKSADFICRTFGPGKDQLKLVPGHEEVEIGLVKLYRLTGRKKYLELAKFFIDQRGNASGHKLYGSYNQDHMPVVDQAEAVGHAVRAAYLYSGVTDIAALTGDNSYMVAMGKIWDDIVSRKLYLTGGIGAAGGIEGFGPAYDLPNPSGYAETCATIAYALWNYRMFLYYGDGKYVDLFERAAYNAFLSGYGLSGDLFFYPNPLASYGQHVRTPWFQCACCPPNVARFIAELGGFSYGVQDDKIYVNLYSQGTAAVETKAGKVALEQTTEYPWRGDIKIKVEPEKASAFTLMVRIPSWAEGKPLPSDLYYYAGESPEKPAVHVNGEVVVLNVEKGYVPVSRTWQKGDVVEISLPMAVRRVLANDNLKSDSGRVAVERGPLVYCAEWTDNGGYASNLVLDDNAVLTAEPRPDLLNGVTVVVGEATAVRSKGGKAVSEKQKLTLVPYFSWAHRGKGEMEVWLARDPSGARVIPEPTLASTAAVSCSEGGTEVEAVHDQYEPVNSADDAPGFLAWSPDKGTAPWVQYDLKGPAAVSEVSVYWFDDSPDGRTRVPASWQLLYRAGDKWTPVKNLRPYGVAKDKYTVVSFSPVRTSALRLEIQAPEKSRVGVLEWKVTTGPFR